MALYVILKFI